MKTTYFKQLFIALFLLITSAGTAVAASWKLSSTSLNQPGSKDTLCVEIVDNDFSFSAFQVDIQLPTGILVDSGPFLGDSIQHWEYSYNIMGQDSHVRLVAYEANNKEITANAGLLFKLPVTIDPSFRKGEVTFTKGLLSKGAALKEEIADQAIALLSQQTVKVTITKGLEQMESQTPAEIAFDVVPAALKNQMIVKYFSDDNCHTLATDSDRMKPGKIYAKITFEGNELYEAFSEVYTMTILAKQIIKLSDVKGLEQSEGILTPITFVSDPADLALTVTYHTEEACTTENQIDLKEPIKPGIIYAKIAFEGNNTVAAFEQIYPIRIVAKGQLIVNVSGLEQIYNKDKAAEISYTTVPAGIKLAVDYYTNDACTVIATEADRKKVGLLYVKLTYAGNDSIGSYEQTYQLLLTDKKDLTTEADATFSWPTATAIVKGQSLGNALLMSGSVSAGGLNVPGSFVWTDPTIMPVAGDGQYSVTFLPNNSNYYKSVESTIALHVKDIYRIAVESGKNGSAMIIGQTKDSLYVEGEQITLKAMPDANYQFAGWTLRTNSETAAGDNAEMSVKVAAAGTYVATFAPIKHKVTKSVTGDGTLTVTVVESNQHVNDGDQIQQGSTLKVEAKAGENYQLSALTLNNQALAGDKFTLAGAADLQAVFTEKPAERHTLTINPVTNGSLVVYNKQGSPVASGSTLAEGETIILVALPAAGYQMKDGSLKIGSEALSGTTYTVGKTDFEASVEFEEKQYAVTAKSVGTDGKAFDKQITLNATGNQAYGTKITITGVPEDGKLVAILANGKDYGKDWKNLSFTVTGALEITAMFDKRVDIEKRYIMWPYQEFYYNGTSRNFFPFVSQTYAGFDFLVKYKLGDAAEIDKAINAGNYDVHLTREADALYNKFDETYKEGLVIKKSKIRVTEGLNPATGKPKTYPTNTDIKVVESTDNYTKFEINPTGDDLDNYDGITYYWEIPGAKKAKFSVGNQLRASTDGGVRITNGGVLIESDSLTVGMQVALEAIPNEGYQFAGWTDGNKDNPRLVTINADETKNSYVPNFTGKEEITLAVENSTYTGVVQQPILKGADELSFKVDAFMDAARTQPASEIKNAGTYYLKIYRPEDKDYKTYQNNELTFTINKANLTDITWPTASDIKVGDALSASTLMGGNAGIVTGTFEWADPTEQATETGTKSFKVKFVPNDTKNYPASVEGNVSVTILDAPVAALKLDKATMSLTKGTTGTLTVTGVPEGAKAAWSSDNTEVATVDENGKVTAVAAGTATITVTVQTNSGNLTATCVVTVTEPTNPEQPTEEPTNPEQPIKPEQVPDPVVEQRTDSTAVITWDKVSGAESYKLFLYADKSKKELIATYTFDKDGNLKATNIAFNLQNLVAGKSYYIETVAYDATGKALVTKSVELTAEPTATEEVTSSIEVYTSRGMIHIQLSQPMGVRIMNMAGSFVYDAAAAEGRVDVPVASAGIYAVILYERNQLIEVKKVIVR